MISKYPLRLRPVTKEILWGGDRLQKKYHIRADFEKLAEAWELTVRPDGINCIDNGKYTGMPLDAYIQHAPKSILGSAGITRDRFPLLIKFIDAHDNLSIQVHPDDEYSLAHENELGKMEMWYIVEAAPGASLVYGLRDSCTMEDFVRAVAEGQTETVLRRIPVRAGETYFIPSGQIHAIGAGCLIAEIQQNSNVTYRVYDYNRRQADGSLRPLHVQQALDVVRLRTDAEVNALRFSHQSRNTSENTLCDCAYFRVRHFNTSTDCGAELYVHDNSFLSLLILQAENATLFHDGVAYEISAGDSFFLPAGLGRIQWKGHAEFLATNAN